MAKKLLSEAQVRKFMGLANMDANLSSNFLTEMYGKEEDMEEGMYAKRDDEGVMKEEEDEMGDMDAAADEGGEDLSEPADMDEPEMGMDKEEIAKELIQAIGSVLGVDLDIDSEPGGEMDMPAEEPEMEMDAEMEMDEEEPEMMEDVNLQLSEDEIVQEVAKRVAKRINEAARAQKKADKLLGRNKK